MTAPPLLVLVGPAAAGKSTLGRLVAAELGVPFVDVDAIGDRYYGEVGWSIDRLVARTAAVGRVAAEREWEPARAHAVERVVAENPDAVVALGAGHTCLTTPEHAARVRAALATVPHVVLVRPWPDRDASLEVLRRRSVASKGRDWIADGHDFLAEWLDDATTADVAHHVLVTGDDTAATSATRLRALVRRGEPQYAPVR